MAGPTTVGKLYNMDNMEKNYTNNTVILCLRIIITMIIVYPAFWRDADKPINRIVRGTPRFTSYLFMPAKSILFAYVLLIFYRTARTCVRKTEQLENDVRQEFYEQSIYIDLKTNKSFYKLIQYV